MVFSFMIACMLFPFFVYSIDLKQKDDKGVYHFTCEEFTSDRLKIKLIDKGTYKALGAYTGKIIKAASVFKAALILCGEDTDQPAEKKE